MTRRKKIYLSTDLWSFTKKFSARLDRAICGRVRGASRENQSQSCNPATFCFAQTKKTKLIFYSILNEYSVCLEAKHLLILKKLSTEWCCKFYWAELKVFSVVLNKMPSLQAFYFWSFYFLSFQGKKKCLKKTCQIVEEKTYLHRNTKSR